MSYIKSDVARPSVPLRVLSRGIPQRVCRRRSAKIRILWDFRLALPTGFEPVFQP